MIGRALGYSKSLRGVETVLLVLDATAAALRIFLGNSSSIYYLLAILQPVLVFMIINTKYNNYDALVRTPQFRSTYLWQLA